MTSRKLLQDLKAGFREPKTERKDRPTTNIPFLHQGTSMGKIAFVCFCHGGMGPKKGHDMIELASPQEYIDRDITKN